MAMPSFDHPLFLKQPVVAHELIFTVMAIFVGTTSAILPEWLPFLNKTAIMAPDK